MMTVKQLEERIENLENQNFELQDWRDYYKEEGDLGMAQQKQAEISNLYRETGIYEERLRQLKSKPTYDW